MTFILPTPARFDYLTFGDYLTSLLHIRHDTSMVVDRLQSHHITRKLCNVILCEYSYHEYHLSGVIVVCINHSSNKQYHASQQRFKVKHIQRIYSILEMSHIRNIETYIYKYCPMYIHDSQRQFPVSSDTWVSRIHSECSVMYSKSMSSTYIQTYPACLCV